MRNYLEKLRKLVSYKIFYFLANHPKTLKKLEDVTVRLYKTEYQNLTELLIVKNLTYFVYAVSKRLLNSSNCIHLILIEYKRESLVEKHRNL